MARHDLYSSKWVPEFLAAKEAPVTSSVERTKNAAHKLTDNGERLTSKNYEDYFWKCIHIHNKNSNVWENMWILIWECKDGLVISENLNAYQSILSENGWVVPSKEEIGEYVRLYRNFDIVSLDDKRLYSKPWHIMHH
jgi:hypothetical protein